MVRKNARMYDRQNVRRIVRILLIVLAWLAGLVVLAALAGLLAVRASLPRLDGEHAVAALAGPVTVARDSLGVPDIAAASRVDAAVALGYLHAQDRFFQMDLQRRSAAGELAALIGPALRPTDRDVRRHRFRARAQQVLAGLDAGKLQIVEAYTAGVNAGLADLRTPPFEYLLLRQRPRPWLDADTILTLYAMYLDLGLDAARSERMALTVQDRLAPPLAELLLPRGNRWDAPLQPEPVPGVVIPDSGAVDLRDRLWAGRSFREYRSDPAAAREEPARQDAHGSNSWAVTGRRTAHGGALLANDMHLSLGLPNIWYRARMSWPEGDRRRSVVGLTLPGTPALVSGSNGDLAWGFTVPYADACDLVDIETDPADPGRYRTPDGWRRFETVREIIESAGAAPDTLVIEETIWGPVWDDAPGRKLALRWAAHDVEAVNLDLIGMESMPSVAAACAAAGAIGVPQLNLVCADRDGHIGWVLMGRLPRRVGWDGRLPVSWADGSCRWDGYLDAAEHPRLIDPDEGLLWTANNRVAAGGDLAKIGDGGYALGARARQIRDDLRALERPTERDMLAVQLDDRALYQAEWRELALRALAAPGAADDPLRAEFLRIVRDGWSGRAEPASAAYRLVRNFSDQCVDGVYDYLVTVCRDADPGFDARWLPYRPAVAWEMIAARPPHLLAPWYADWDDFLLQAVDRTCARAVQASGSLADHTWGRRNVVRIRHPFVRIAPQMERWLAAPGQPLPGDSKMPRVQGVGHGASDRLVVSPGLESEGLLHMPGGQSGHPLSPYFLAGHAAWAEGRPVPLLPGPPRHVLQLVP